MSIGSVRASESVSALVVFALLFSQCRVDDPGEYAFDAEGGEAGESSTSGRGGGSGASGGSASAQGGGSGGGQSGGGREGGESGGAGGELPGEGGGAGDIDPGTGGGDADAGAGGESGSVGGAPPTNTGGVAGNCTTRCAPLGAECTAPNDCESGRCVDGVCCESICNRPCEACRGDLTGAADGVCEAVLPDTDPDDDCEEEPASTCGQTGLCDGEGSCALYAAGTVCAEADCFGGVEYGARTCDGLGSCGDAESSACAPYPCGETACRTECGNNDECTGNAVCVDDECREPSDLLEPCDENADCARGECIGSRCALKLVSIRITGSAVPGGGDPQTFTEGWWKSDENGRNLEAVPPLITIGRLWDSQDKSAPFTSPLPPDTYLLLAGAESSNALTRRFQFNLSDGTAVTKDVDASGAQDIILSVYPTEGDIYVLFHFTGADVNVLRKTY